MNIEKLYTIVSERINENADDSYTVKLVNSGINRVAQKVGEEGVEVALAAVSGDKAELVGELSDLMFHSIVLMKASNVTLDDIYDELEKRHQKKESEK